MPVSLRERLEDHLAREPMSYRQAVEWIDGAMVRAEIERLLSGRSQDSQAVSGYRHPNGFLKIRLVSSPTSRWVLRLHVWSPGVDDGDVHNHRWDFASNVLNGRLREVIYEPLPGEGEFATYLCASNPTRPEYRFRRLGDCGLREISEELHAAGETYLREHPHLHAIDAISPDPMVTVVLQGPPVAESTTVVMSDPAQWREATLKPRQLNRREIAQSLQGIASLLR